MRRRGHAHVPQEEQNDNDQEEDEEEEFVNHRSHVAPTIPNITTSTNTASDHEEESVADASSNSLENIELANHHQQQHQQQHRSSEEFHDHPSSNTIDTSSGHDVEEGGRFHHDNNDNHHDNEDSFQEQLRFSYQRKTLLCNVFTVFVLFQMWFGWNDYTNANDISNEATTLDGIIVTILFSLIVIGINIQMRHVYHEQWQEQSSQVLSLISTSTSESSTAQPHDGRERTLQRQSQQQPQPPRFLTWDDILHLSQSTQESQNGQTHHHIDLSMLSYQAQLAYAIMESQRHIIETGGYGNPDGPETKQGVSVETIQSWKTFLYNPNVGGTIDTGKNMTDTSTVLPTKPFEKEGPTCCICLCEYETNEELKEITPCGHWYHSDCIIGWVKHHTTCPLCQVELESK